MDSRSAHRYSVDLSGTLLMGTTVVSCRVQNVSLGGVYIRGPVIESGSHITLRFEGPGLPSIETTCTARWCTDEGTGLAFDSLRSEDSFALSRFVRARTTGASAALPREAD